MMKMFVNVLTPFAFGHLRLALVVSHKDPDRERTSTEQTHVIIRLNNNNKNNKQQKQHHHCHPHRVTLRPLEEGKLCRCRPQR